jgi:hypothetical protein
LSDVNILTLNGDLFFSLHCANLLLVLCIVKIIISLSRAPFASRAL